MGLLSMGRERVGNDLATKQQPQEDSRTYYLLFLILLPPLQPLETTKCTLCLPAFAYLCLLYKLGHEIYGLSHVISVSEHRVFRVHLYCSLCQTFTPFHGCVIFHRVDGPYAV